MVETSSIVTPKLIPNGNLSTTLKLDDECLYLEKTKSNEINLPPNNSEEKNLNHTKVIVERQGGTFNKNVLPILVAWYITSALTLFSNKYILTIHKSDTTFLGKLSIKIE
jgi:hypothetical protein